MKNTCISVLFIVMSCSSLQAQYMMSRRPPNYPVVHQAGATLAQIIDTMQAYTNPADTSEGGAMDQLAAFQNYWQARVATNDSSGHSMFDEYLKALRAAVIDGEASLDSTKV